MNLLPKKILSWLLSTTGLNRFPVRVRSGYAAGARWTLYPWTAYWRGTHEPELQRALESLGEMRGWSCWDLGAHYGLYSVGLAQRVGPAGEVCAFEPNPLSFTRLELHQRMNKLAWLKPLPLAVSDAVGSAEFNTYGDLDSTSTHLPYDGEPQNDQAKPINVSTATLDSLVASGRIRPPDFIKVDVEGHAHKALAGARSSLKAKRPILIVAFHSSAEVGGVFEILEPLGYTWRRITGGADGPASERPGDAMITHDYIFWPPAKR